MPTVLITGANRGIGLEHAKVYAEKGWKVLACCRNPDAAADLRTLAGRDGLDISVHALDVTDPDSVAALGAELKDLAIDILMNNAGTTGPKEYDEQMKDHMFGNMDYDNWVDIFKVNTMGPMRMAEAFVDNVARSEEKTIINISTHFGSIAIQQEGRGYGYASTKAALNMVTKLLSCELKDRGITVIALAPGRVKTRLGGWDDAPLTVEFSVAKQHEVLDSLGPENTGEFWAFRGDQVPW